MHLYGTIGKIRAICPRSHIHRHDQTLDLLQPCRSLLFQCKYNEAAALYLQYKDELKDSYLQNLQDYEAAGVIPEDRKADVERIRKMLNE